MTTNNSDAAVDGSRKRRARAVQAKLKELGSSVSLGQAYEVMAVANGFRNWATMNAAATIPAEANSKPSEPTAPRSDRGYLRTLVGWNSNPVDGLCAIHASDEDYDRHFSVSADPDDRFSIMLGLAEGRLSSGGGMLYVDHSGDGRAEALIRDLARSIGREHDVVVMDSEGGHNHLYDPFAEQQSGLGPMRIVTAMAARLSDIDLTCIPNPSRFDDKLLDVYRMIVEAARFRASRDRVPLNAELILAMARAETFAAAATEDWEADADAGYWMPLSLKADMERHCLNFADEPGKTVRRLEMKTYHRRVAESLENILRRLPADRQLRRCNVHRLVRDRKIGILRLDPTDVHSHLNTANLVISEIERALEEGPVPPPGPQSGTKFVMALQGFLPTFMKGVHARAEAAAARDIVLMSEAPADPAMVAGWNAVSIADPSRLTVKLAWASGTPGHPSEFDVPDHRIKT